MEQDRNSQIQAILKEFQERFEVLNQRKFDLVKRIVKTIDDRKLGRIRKRLGISN